MESFYRSILVRIDAFKNEEADKICGESVPVSAAARLAGQ